MKKVFAFLWSFRPWQIAPMYDPEYVDMYDGEGAIEVK